MATQQEVIKSVMNSLSLTTKTGTSALDEAIRTGTNYKFSSLSDLKTQFLSDIRTVNDADEFLKDYCDIILGNSDTGAITGSDAGNGLVKTKESIVLETTGVDDWDYVAPGSTVTLSSGLKVNMPSAREDGSALTTNDMFILKGLPHWLEAGIKLNKESYGLDFRGTDVKTIYVSLYDDANDNALASCGPNGYYNSAGKATRAYLDINLYYYSNLDVTDENGESKSTSLYLDRTIAHELNHAILAANTKYAKSLPAYITEGSAELVHGVDDTRNAISVLAGDSNLMSKALTSEYWTDYPTVYGGDGTKLNSPAYAGGYTLWRYMAKQSATSYTKTFNGTSDAEFFETENDRVSIYSGAGNDTLYNGSRTGKARGGDHVFLYASSGKNLISNNGGNYITMQSGAGNDTVWNGGDFVTIEPGKGNDTVTNYYGANVTFIYNDGDGNDLIKGITSTSTISIAGAEATRKTSGSNVIFGVGSGSITVNGGANVDFTLINDFTPTGVTLANSSPNQLIEGTKYADSISNNGWVVTIEADAGDDTINNSEMWVTINGGAGNDKIENYYGESASVNGGAGDDYISNDSGGTKVTILGGANNDSVLNYADSVSIDGGTGNDSLHNDGSNVTINAGTGNDTVWTHNSSNVSINLGTGNDSLNNRSSSVTIIGGTGTDTLSLNNGGTGILADCGTGNDFVQSFASNSTLRGSDGDDTIGNYKYAYNGDSLVSEDAGKNVLIEGGNGNDSLTSRGNFVTISGGAGNDFLWNSKIDGGGSTVSISGGAGDDSIYCNGSTVTITGGTGNDFVSLGGSNNLIQYANGDGNDTIKGFNATSTLKIGNGTTDTYSKETKSDDLIVSVGDGSITLTGAASLKAPNILGTEKNSRNIVGTEGADKITNSLASATISALGGNDTVKNTGASVSLNGGAGNDSISNSGTKVTILGGDDNEKIINSGTYAKINAGAGNDSIKNSAASVSIVGGSGKDTVNNTKTKVTIDAGSGNDRIVNSAASVSIIAGTGNDLVSLGANAKNNFITYSAGNDTIKGFNATSTLKLGNGSDTYTKTTDGKDLILTVGDGSVTLTGAASLTKPKILGEEITPTVVFTDDDAAKQTLAPGVEIADASARTKAIRIVGNALYNSILGGSGKDTLYGKNGNDYLAGNAGADKLYGQNGSDTLWGGVGNDTLTGGSGADVFIYESGEGKDVITDFANNDLLQITGTFSATYSKSTNTIAFKVGSTANAITLKDFTATTFNINSFNYKISGTKLVKK